MPASRRALVLSLLPKPFAICRLAAEAPLPQWATGGQFFSITRTSEELSVVVEADLVPGTLRAETGWRAMKVHGPLDLSAVGILASLVGPLAKAQISVFTISTFDTDYLFTKVVQLQTALKALREAGYTVHENESIS